MTVTIQLRRDTASNWNTVNPVLAQGEVGLELDTKRGKIGDGSTTWSNLSYATMPPELIEELLDNKTDNFAVNTPLTFNSQWNSNANPSSGAVLSSAGVLSDTITEDYWVVDTDVLPNYIDNQLSYWEFNVRFRTTSSTSAMPFFGIADSTDDNVSIIFIELHVTNGYLETQNEVTNIAIPTNTWITMQIIHNANTTTGKAILDIEGTKYIVDNVIDETYTLSSSSNVVWVGLGVTPFEFDVTWDGFNCKTEPDGVRYAVLTDKHLGVGLDNTPTSSSTNLMTSGSIYTALSGYVSSSALNDYVTLATDQNITGVKTFIGQKRVGFKQSSSSDKLGFTLYNNSGTEKGYLEFNPSNLVDGVPLMTLGNYASASAGLTHVGFRKYSNVSGANGAYNLLAPLISDARTPFNLTTTYTNFYLPLGFTNGVTTVTTAKSGVVDLSSLVDQTFDGTSSNAQSGVAIENYLANYATTDAVDTLTASLNQVAFTGDYSYLTNTPTVDQTYDSTSTNAQSGVAIAGIGFVQNTATSLGDLTLNGTPTTYYKSINIGSDSSITGGYSVALGDDTTASTSGTAIGYNAKATVTGAIQIGSGTNSTTNSLSIGLSSNNYQLLDSSGLIPDARLSSNIARTSSVTAITNLIPSQATSSNQLADKAFVNSTVQTSTANFRGNWEDWTDVPTSSSDYPEDYAGSKVPTVNDYLVVQDASDYTGDTLTGTWRFKYTGTWSTDGKSGWIPEYQVNETPLTASQLAALNSGITSNDVTLIGTALQPNDNITQLTNNAGYISGITSSDVTNALGYTPYNSTNPNGYISSINSNDVTTALGYTPQEELVAGTNISIDDYLYWTTPTNISMPISTTIVGFSENIVLTANGQVFSVNDTLDTWTARGTITPTYSWVSLYKGVAIASSGHLCKNVGANSPTVTSYGQLTALNSWKGIAVGEGTWVAITSDGYVSSSNGGNSWSTPTQSLGDIIPNSGSHRYNWAWISYGGGTFLALGDGYYATSLDGSTWTISTTPWVGGLTVVKSLTYDGNNFVAVDSNRNVYSSPDGASWTKIGTSIPLPGGGGSVSYLIDYNTSIEKFQAVSAGGYFTLGSYSPTIDTKITGAISNLLSSNLTVSRALVSNASGKVGVSSVTSTELGYLSGATSSIQTQINRIQTLQSISTVSGSTISLSYNYSIYKSTPNSATTYTFSTTGITQASSSIAYTFELCVVMTSTVYTLTFPSSVSWQDGEIPDLSATGTYFFVFRTIDGGTTWLGNLQGRW